MAGVEEELRTLLPAKVALLCVVGFATLAASLTPWFAANFLTSQKALDFVRVAAAASAGVITGTLLCHMLPESEESFHEYLQERFAPDGVQPESESTQRLMGYPYAHMICGAVLLLLLAIDQLLSHSHLDDSGHSHGQTEHRHDHISASIAAVSEHAHATAPCEMHNDVCKPTPPHNHDNEDAEAGHGHSHGGHGHSHGSAHGHAHGGSDDSSGHENDHHCGLHHQHRRESGSQASMPAVNLQISPTPVDVLLTPADAASPPEPAAAALAPPSAAPVGDAPVEPAAGAVALTVAPLVVPAPTATLRVKTTAAAVLAPAPTEATPAPTAGMLADDGDEGEAAHRAPTCRDGCAAAMGCGVRRHERRVVSLVAAKAKLGSARQLVVRAWVFSLAMSVHGFFDGLGVGVAATSAGFTSILVAVVSHKLFDGFSLGATLFLADLPLLHRWAMLLVTSGTTPLGIGIGLAVVSTLSSQALQLATAIILAMAAGSFAFIGLLELLPSALLDGRLVHLKLAVFGLGYTGMAVLAAYK